MNSIQKYFRRKIENRLVLKSLRDVHKNASFQGNVTEHNFKQGNSGNCCMIAAMASLATNDQIYNKVVEQSDSKSKTLEEIDAAITNKNCTKIVFNLYKSGKLYRVEVNDNLWCFFNKLYYSRSSNNNFFGSLLEKALVELHFDGKYKSAEGCNELVMLSSLTNALFEKLVFNRNFLIYENHDIILHGVKTKSLMVVSFKKTGRKFNLRPRHAYLLVDMNKDIVKLYNPHGKIMEVPKQTFFGHVATVGISYFDNKVFGMPGEIKLSDTIESWRQDEDPQTSLYICHNLTVVEDDTWWLVNLLCSQNLMIEFNALIYGRDGFSTADLGCQLKFYVEGNDSIRLRCKRGRYVLVYILRNNDYNAPHYNDILQCPDAEKHKVFIRYASNK